MNAVIAENDSSGILIVEDEALVACDIESRLSGMGYNVCAKTRSGEKALEIAERSRPDLALMDISLNGPIDGVETASIMQEKHRLPVVFLTAHADSSTLRRAKLAMPLGYIVKPYTEQDLRVTLEMAFYRELMRRQGQDDQETLRLREMQMRTAIETAADAIIIADEKGRIRWFNFTAEWMFGYRADEIIGKDLHIILPAASTVVNGDAQGIWEAARLNSGIRVVVETEGRHSSGQTVTVELAVAEWVTGGQCCLTLVLRDGTEHRKLEQELKSSNRELLNINAKLDKFADLVSHEFCTPIRAVRNTTRGIVEKLDQKAGDKIGVEIDRIAQQSANMSYMLDDLLEYCRAGNDYGGVDQFTLDDEVAEIERSLDADITPSISVMGPVRRFRAHRPAMRLVLRSLIENMTRESGDGVGSPSIHCDECETKLIFTIFGGVDIPPECRKAASGAGIKPQAVTAGRAAMAMALAQRVIEDNGGVMQVVSPPGRQQGMQIQFSWRKYPADAPL